MSNKSLALMMGFVAFLIVAVGAVFAVVAFSGGGDDDDGGEPANSGSESGGSGSSSPSRTATRQASGSSGNSSGICAARSLIIPGDEPLSTFDPILVTDQSTSEYIVEIFGGLVTIDRDLKVVGDVAEKWDISADGKTYTFTLRNNVVFHTTNRRVTANDVKFSLERAADPKSASPTAKAYLGAIVGLTDRLENKAKEISGVKVIDERTVQIQINEPREFFIAELTYPVAYLVDQDQLAKDKNWTRKPAGTGPFKLQEFSPTEKIVLTKNERYHLGAPKLDSVVFELAGGSISTRYENNELHVGFVPAAQLEDVAGNRSKLSEDYVASPQLSVSYMTLNTSKAPFDDPKVRQAMAMSIDRETINNVLLYGYYRVADGIVPPELPGYTASVSSQKYDPEKAKQLLQESKYAGKLPRIIMTYGGSGGNSPDVLTAIQRGWQDIGLDVQLQAVDSAALLREQRRGNFQLLSEGWAADYPDPENFLGKLFASDSPLNYTKYKNDEVDRLLQQARRETDRTKRYELYAQAEQKILDDANVLPIFWPVEHRLVKSCVKDLPAASMTYPKYRYVDIKP